MSEAGFSRAKNHTILLGPQRSRTSGVPGKWRNAHKGSCRATTCRVSRIQSSNTVKILHVGSELKQTSFLFALNYVYFMQVRYHLSTLSKMRARGRLYCTPYELWEIRSSQLHFCKHTVLGELTINGRGRGLHFRIRSRGGSTLH